MRLSDLVAPSRVLVPLEAGTLRDATLALIDRIAADGGLSEPEKLRGRVEEERGEDIVCFGDRAFLAHYRTEGARDLMVAVGVAAQPIARDVGDGEAKRARLVLALVAPPRLAARYLQVLGAFGRVLSRKETVDEIVAAGSAVRIAALPALRDLELPQQLAVRDIMTERPRTVRPDTLLRDAARAMMLGAVRALPVVDDSELVVGMLSERELLRDLLDLFLHGASAKPNAPGGVGGRRRIVRDVMTRQVLCVSPDQPLAEVASLMANKDVEQVPVVREGRLVGFLTRGDIVRKLIGS
ncbi:MAG: CBS domain-containing protein [Gemmatimonadaceae bacterium]